MRVAPRQKTPATLECLSAMLSSIPDTLAGTRDRAILLLGFAGALRRSELAALAVADLEFRPEGLLLTLRQSKTDPEGVGQLVTAPRGKNHCPVAAVQSWLEAGAIASGPLFRPIDKRGRPRSRALSAHSIAALVKTYAAAAGLNPMEFGGHSLRAGLLTSAAERGASVWQLRQVSRHRSVHALQRYVRARDGFRDHAGKDLL
jgi:integrase